ncbi:MAG: bifunctional diaminohydroxyphosphoribosylaminopyrimidine deaminase/5-amino-6-(5-phosphoribosylamino)uracil reductase RibD [Bacteroidales bacterium]|nr:bifunctional diaminohydroxyphosphoribosylaminopyrimidine deaminase/5-amino-6-(5-phosphoribosylamino)uracil reductase RibD [Bacteroidales bacterium]
MEFPTHEFYIKRCFELARLGQSAVAPNPMVGSVIVHKDHIIGEGYHQRWGGPHAEVNAVESVRNKRLLKDSTLYVNLEPCAHHGKTPPCSDMIIALNIPRVVICNTDPFYEVAGKGIQRMQEAGIEVITGILEEEGRFLNRRFFTFHEKKRPYILLKWAQTADGFIDIIRTSQEKPPVWITNQMAKVLVHKWRIEEAGIMVGTNTALLDNPQLTARLWEGKQPVRIVPDRQLRLPDSLHLLDSQVPTIVFTAKNQANRFNIKYFNIDFDSNPLAQMMHILYEEGIQSILVEGGTRLLQSFLEQDIWDEARVFEGNKFFGDGIKAPHISLNPFKEEFIGDSRLMYFYQNPVQQHFPE